MTTGSSKGGGNLERGEKSTRRRARRGNVPYANKTKKEKSSNVSTEQKTQPKLTALRSEEAAGKSRKEEQVEFS